MLKQAKNNPVEVAGFELKRGKEETKYFVLEPAKFIDQKLEYLIIILNWMKLQMSLKSIGTIQRETYAKVFSKSRDLSRK